jgi:NAD(P)-dependent dehydrogenase (short-subunit alcohol dehydrogenase family)
VRRNGIGVLDGKAVIVTGAGQGLGRAFAIGAAAEGAAVVVNDIDAEAAKKVVAEITGRGSRAIPCVGSVADWDGAADLVATCRKEYGAVDGLVNNAGVLRLTPAWDETEGSIRRVVEVNLLGALFVGTHAVRAMLDQGRGSIVNITSSAQLGLPAMGTYGATKGALASLTYGWSVDLGGHFVRVNAYAPVARTAMAELSPVLPPDIPAPADNTAVVTYLLSDLSDGITGQVIQRRGNRLIVLAHPRLTEHGADADDWTIDHVVDRFDPVLREHQEPVGYAIRGS